MGPLTRSSSGIPTRFLSAARRASSASQDGAASGKVPELVSPSGFPPTPKARLTESSIADGPRMAVRERREEGRGGLKGRARPEREESWVADAEREGPCDGACA